MSQYLILINPENDYCVSDYCKQFKHCIAFLKYSKTARRINTKIVTSPDILFDFFND